MDFYPVKKLLKDEQKRAPEKFKPKPQPQIMFNSKSSNFRTIKEEFLNTYYSQEVTSRRFDQKFTICWARKREEKLSEMKALSALREGKDIKSPTSLITITSPIHENKSDDSFSSHLKKEGSESSSTQLIHLIPVPIAKEDSKSHHQTNSEALRKLITPLKVRDFEATSPRLGSRLKDLNGSTSMAWRTKRGPKESNSQSLEPLSATINFQTEPSGLGNMTTQNFNGKKGDILGNLEEIYYNDLKEGNELNPLKFVGTQFDRSPYNVKSTKVVNLKKMKANARSLLRNDKNMLEDQVLMEQFRKPYSNNLPFKNHVNASFRDKKTFKLYELETKAEILRNIKTLNEEVSAEKSLDIGVKKSNLLPNLSVNTERGQKGGDVSVYMRSHRAKICLF